MAKVCESGMPAEDYWETFFHPICVLAAPDCDKRTGDIVEFGCGYGTFTEAAARLNSDTVHAHDIDSEMVEATTSRITDTDLANARVNQRNFLMEGCGLPDRNADYAMLFNILHIEESVTLLQEAFRVLTPGGRAGIIHWNHDPTTPRGSSMEIRPRPEQCRDWSEEAGFELMRFERLDCCLYHYGLVVRRPPLS